MLNKHFPLWPVLLFATLLGSSAVQAAKLYKWTDEAGATHYTQKPPSDTGSDEVISTSEPEIKAEPVDTSPVEIPQPTDLAASQQAAERCMGLYHTLELYQERQPITDSDGNVMVVSEEMRESKIAELKQELDASCR